MVTIGSNKKLPELVLVRNKKKKGSYFGPFIEKGPVRKVYNFLMKTFRLRLCGKKIENGCLYFHLDICAGDCKLDFDEQSYLNRLDFAKKSLKQGHKKFLVYLQEQIAYCNERLEFEKAKEFYEYHKAFENVFTVLNTKFSIANNLTTKEVWILTPDKKALFVFSERERILKKIRVFYFAFDELDIFSLKLDYFLSYYRTFNPASVILINFELLVGDKKLIEEFLKEWHGRQESVSIVNPESGHFASIVRMATIQAEQEQIKKTTLSKALKRLLELPCEPCTIDCFDISHKQGMFLGMGAGSLVFSNLS